MYYTPGGYVKRARAGARGTTAAHAGCQPRALPGTVPRACYNAPMTLVEITFELQSSLKADQLRVLGEFANTYGLRRFSVDQEKRRITFEYDASRLKETEVAQVLRQARIPVLRRREA